MKQRWLIRIFALAALALGAQAQAAYVLDTKMCQKELGNSSQATETAEMQACVDTYFPANGLGTAPTIVFDEKFEQADLGFNIQPDTVAGQWYVNVTPNQPGFFSLKFGTGSFTAGTPDTFFFMNIGELTKLVFNESQVAFLIGGCGRDACNSGRLSHYSLYNDGGQVPEPASLALLGAGLVGIALVRRRRRD